MNLHKQSQMNYCKTPCSDCPFRKDSIAGWLSEYTTQDLHSLVMNEIPFPCHMTHDRDLEFDEAGEAETPLCAGALRYMRKAGKSPRRQDLAFLLKSIDRNDCENILSVPEFFKHHSAEEIEK